VNVRSACRPWRCTVATSQLSLVLYPARCAADLDLRPADDRLLVLQIRNKL
jgi:hypothetical protein